MRRVGIVVKRLALALMGAVAVYVVVYGSTGWLADTLGYETALGRGLGFVNGAISPLAWGIVVVPILAAGLFWLLSKFVFVQAGIEPADK